MADRLSLTILGSGGPMHGGGRGSSAYLLRIADRPILAVDMGGDTPRALAAAGCSPGALPLVLVSHMHPDHVSGLPDFLWGEMTAGRTSPLRLAGPAGSGRFRGMVEFVDRLVGPEGAWPDLQGLLDGTEFPLRATECEEGPLETGAADLRVSALAVPHGRAPTLAFKVTTAGRTIVFGGDQTYRTPEFVAFAAQADVLVAHVILGRSEPGDPLRAVAAGPEEIARAAAEAKVGALVLSHWMSVPGPSATNSAWSGASTQDVVEAISAVFPGTVIPAQDGEVVTI